MSACPRTIKPMLMQRNQCRQSGRSRCLRVCSVRSIRPDLHSNSTLGRVFCALFVIAVAAQPVCADDLGMEFFEKKIRPVLVRHCHKCHSAASSNPEGGLRLDSRAGIRRGGETGPAVVPDQIDESLLIEALRYESLEMPPDEQLPERVIDDFVRWIEMGAPDPRESRVATSDADTWQAILAARRDIWSLRPIRQIVPLVAAGPADSGNAVDRFIDAKLREAGLQSVEMADRHALIRRLSFALTGLPPTPEAIDTFVGDQVPNAWERLVDRVLASPHFGERWARHWMDVVRFSETHGHEWNFEIRGAWRYRDYLIRAFNHDVPYDQIVREHIAGDLLNEPRWNAHLQINESLIGTAFYRFGEVGHDDCLEFREISLDVIDNQIDTFSKAFQAMTVSCARCHDHKLDAVSMRDYYALSGIFSSSRYVARTIDAPNVNDDIKSQLVRLNDEIRQELAELWMRSVDRTDEYLLAAQSTQNQESHVTGAPLDEKLLSRWVVALEAVNNDDEEEPSVEHPFYLWQRMASSGGGAVWEELRETCAGEHRARSEFNAKNFISFGDFPGPGARSAKEEYRWHADGLGADEAWCCSGEFSVMPDGEEVLQGLLPAGFHTHRLSNRLNGALRSPMLPKTKKFLSVKVLGQGESGLRKIYDNCHLNVGTKLLATDEPKWITVSTASEYSDSRVYAALVTRFSNQAWPKYDTQTQVDPNNIRSWFGVMRAVLHDCEDPPRDELTHIQKLLRGPTVTNLQELADRYAETICQAVSAWVAKQSIDDDVRWINWLLKNNLLTTSTTATPRLDELVAQYRAVESRIPPPRILNAMLDIDPAVDVPLRVRGDPFKLGDRVPRRYLEVLTGSADPLVVDGSGRRELAEMIASPDNPLTARVMVNRVWHHLFGAGIVRTTDDFGSIGERPSHPQLLDYLAWQFIEDGWSIKRLIRTLILTRTFRMSSHPFAGAMQKDPENRLLHHYPLRRLDAESIRDSFLFTSHRLETKLHGRSIHPWRSVERLDRRLFRGPLDGDGRRSVYLKVTLTEEPPFLSVFNLPEAKVTRGRRDVTNVPSQALTLLNAPFVNEQAEFWAARIISGPGTVSERIERMFLRTLGRPPRPVESERFVKLLDQLAGLQGISSDNVLTSQQLWKDVAHSMFNLKEFIYIR